MRAELRITYWPRYHNFIARRHEIEDIGRETRKFIEIMEL